MDDLTRFAIGWAVVLAVIPLVMIFRQTARWCAARIMREAAEPPHSVWHVDRDGRVRTDARPIVLRAAKR